LAFSAVVASTVGMFLVPLPAAAAPPAPPVGIPDTGLRPTPVGTLTMPGAVPTGTTGTPISTPGASPLLQQVEAKRAQVALLGDRLLKIQQDENAARDQQRIVQSRLATAQTALAVAQENADKAAADAVKAAAALPAGEFRSRLHGLGTLGRIQRGQSPGQQAAVRQFTLAQAAETAARADLATATTKLESITTQRGRLEQEYQREQAALSKLEQDNTAQLAADEAAVTAAEQGLGLVGGDALTGGAHPKALGAVGYALKQLGDRYVWAEEGPDAFDCSGLVLASYLSVGYTSLPRVSYDQYAATRGKSVPRTALLPGDLLFYSSSNSWTDVHHVAMYVGGGKMIEAARAGIPVRITPVRWTRLFAATRIYGAVAQPAPLPVLPPNPPAAKPTPTPSPSPSSSPSASPSASASPSTSPSPSPSASPSPSTSPSPSPDPSPSGDKPSPSGDKPDDSASPSATKAATPASQSVASASKSAEPSKSGSPSSGR
jgi:cell wall-associated NlpC family hydrolase